VALQACLAKEHNIKGKVYIAGEDHGGECFFVRALSFPWPIPSRADTCFMCVQCDLCIQLKSFFGAGLDSSTTFLIVKCIQNFTKALEVRLHRH